MRLLPEASRRNRSIEDFAVSEEQSRLDLLRSMGCGGRYVPAGQSMRLMSDDDAASKETCRVDHFTGGSRRRDCLTGWKISHQLDALPGG